MKQRVLTGIVFTLVIAAFVGPGLKWPWITLLLLLFVGMACVKELINAVMARQLAPSHIWTYIGSLTFLLPLIFTGILNPLAGSAGYLDTLVYGLSSAGFGLLSIMTLNMLLPLLRRGPQAIPSMAAGSLISGYVAFPLACSVLLLYAIPHGWFWLVMALLTPWASDVFAYFTGSAIGKNHILPKISPKKTIEGCLGGIAGSMIAMVLYFILVMQRADGKDIKLLYLILFALAAGLLLSVASQFGDWLASAVKRWCNIKDFGRLLPGHGGVLDRFDSAFFTMPVTLMLAVLYWQLF